jgi:hypothetical protein
MTVYLDRRGRSYFVAAGTSKYKTFRTLLRGDLRPYVKTPWRDTFEEAQRDLDVLAKKKGWETHESY